MTDRPILFSAPMIRALMDGRKTQTRRVLNPQPPEQPAPDCHPSHTPKHPAPYLDAYCGEPKTPQNPRGMSRIWHWWQVDDRPGAPVCKVPCVPGDRLWVRENCATWEGDYRDVVYRADVTDSDWSDLSSDARNGAPWKRRSSIHMPRWASRLTLVVTDVRVQLLQKISEADAEAEGLASVTKDGRLWKWGIPDRDRLPGIDDLGWRWRDWDKDPRVAFARLWNTIHGPDAWDTNPWVVALTFDVHRCNIDQMKAP